MKIGRIVMIVVGSLLALLGFGLLASGTAGLIAYGTQRSDGFFQTGEVRLASPTYAITSDRVDLESEPGDADWLVDRGALGTVRLRLDPARPETPIFAAIGPTAEVTDFLEEFPATRSATSSSPPTASSTGASRARLRPSRPGTSRSGWPR